MFASILFVGLTILGPQPTVLDLSLPRAAALVDLDCSDFGVREAAQAERDRHSSDIYRLDADQDGESCEELPRGSLWTAGGAGLLMLVYLLDVLRKQGERGWAQPLILSFAFASVAGLLGMIVPRWLPRGTPAIAYGLLGAAAAGAWIRFVEKRGSEGR